MKYKHRKQLYDLFNHNNMYMILMNFSFFRLQGIICTGSGTTVGDGMDGVVGATTVLSINVF